jgi:elongator complex protein 1
MYRDTSEIKSQNETAKVFTDGVNGVHEPIGTSKVNRICDAFLEILRSRMSTNLQNVITAHLCKVPPDLDAGLLEVAKLWGKFCKTCASLYLTDENRNRS